MMRHRNDGEWARGPAMRRRASAGLTLIEVLLSMLVLVVGIVGVMALFPTAIWTSKRSVEEMQASMIAESVKNALTNAMQFKNAANQVIFTHDFQRTDGGAKQIYQFALPTYAQGWQRHPGGAASNGAAPLAAEGTLQPGIPVFELIGDPWMLGSTEYIGKPGVAQGSRDSSAREYHLYAYSFDVRLVDLTPWAPNPDANNRLWEFVVHVFRRLPQAPPGADWQLSGTPVKYRWILSMSDRIALK